MQIWASQALKEKVQSKCSIRKLSGHYSMKPRLRIIDSRENQPINLKRVSLERTTERWTPDNKARNQEKELRNEEVVARDQRDCPSLLGFQMAMRQSGKFSPGREPSASGGLPLIFPCLQGLIARLCCLVGLVLLLLQCLKILALDIVPNFITKAREPVPDTPSQTTAEMLGHMFNNSISLMLNFLKLIITLMMKGFFDYGLRTPCS
ncbi:uncharacterized protein LOC102152522 [Canis lupus familiaris]|uniref:uncharacterized protein LOC102152522 n=1 Tax=Canis lupus familiaris TaxID=9615 RepID=UPI0018F77322|nr:uncharacterized protein LOC102152522 [Canis lupus familiaris]XP_038433048.1 uncharacterized protein LOC102152522 [Canis lupus familiaris]